MNRDKLNTLIRRGLAVIVRSKRESIDVQNAFFSLGIYWNAGQRRPISSPTVHVMSQGPVIIYTIEKHSGDRERAILFSDYDYFKSEYPHSPTISANVFLQYIGLVRTGQMMLILPEVQ